MHLRAHLQEESDFMLKHGYKRLMICTLALALSAAATANDQVGDIISQSKSIQAQSNLDINDFKGMQLSDEALQFAQEIVTSSKPLANDALPKAKEFLGVDDDAVINAVKPEGEWVDIYVSRSMGPQLQQLIKDLDGTSLPVRLVFRGVDEGQRINDTFADFARWVEGLESPPAAILDPTEFSDHKVTTVPHMIYMRDGKALANVRGLNNPQWLAEAVERGERGDLGLRGPVEEIQERDLIEELKERAAGLDMESKKEETVRTYWKRAKFITLPPATTEQQREIDPSVYVAKDIRDPKGSLLAQAGTVINPLGLRPFTLRMVIFNPTRKAEVEWVKNLPPAPGRQDVFIATQIDRAAGWDHLVEIQDLLDQPVYLLQSDVQQRFEIRRTPTVVTSTKTRFVVTEYAPQKAPSHAEN